MSTEQRANQPDSVQVIKSQELFGQQNQVVIQHGDKQYRLCVTKENKLILTK
jgi:hemin uptake protein HemP